MGSAELTQTVEYWSTWAAQSENRHFDIAIFKIWIQFERALVELFESYIQGTESCKEYCPKRILPFKDFGHYRNLTMRPSEKYLNHLQHAEEKSKFIFDHNDNPFGTIFNSSPFLYVIREVEAIRNFVAHESNEAKDKYKKLCLVGPQRPDIEPNMYLQTIKKNTNKTFFTYYTEQLIEIIKFCEDPRPVPEIAP